jgi:hypothetical protein
MNVRELSQQLVELNARGHGNELVYVAEEVFGDPQAVESIELTRSGVQLWIDR